MNSLRYIHAADLHLDTPFLGLSRTDAGEALQAQLRDATFTALQRLFDQCERLRPDFLVLAGDIYNQEEHSVKAQLALRDGCVRLQACGIPVFWAHGNHDPLDSRLKTVDWPDNVTIFGPEPEQHVLYRDGAPLVVIHGISHARIREARNLALLFHRQPETDCFQLGVLHCSVEGSPTQDRYAPCSLDDLHAAGLDAWALGHVHERRILARHPFIAYPGNTQGLHINEGGPRGCLLVTAEACDGAFSCREEFLPLGPVQWQRPVIGLDAVEQLDAVEDRLLEALTTVTEKADASCTLMVVRLCLQGRTPLDSLLRRPETCRDLRERLHQAPLPLPVHIKDLCVETAPAVDMAACLQRQDLLGEALRLAEGLGQQPEALAAFAEEELAPLFRHCPAGMLDMPEGEDLQDLLDEARYLCLDMLEGK